MKIKKNKKQTVSFQNVSGYSFDRLKDFDI